MVKKVISFTVDENFFEEWKTYVGLNSINSSRLIETLLKKYLEKKQ